MGSNSLDSGARIAQSANSLDASPDLDDTLVSQALSLYQSAREGGRAAGTSPAREDQRLGCGLLPNNTARSEDKTPTIVSAKVDKANHLELIFEVPYKRDAVTNRYPWEVRESDNRLQVWDQAKRGPLDGPGKPYACVSVREVERKPVDEITVSCSSRVRISEEPSFGCSKRVNIDVDLKDFYLCSSHIQLKPDWTKEGEPRDHYGCICKPLPAPRDDIYGCINRIDGNPKGSSIFGCVSRFDPRSENHSRIFACAAKITPIEAAGVPDIYLCVDRTNANRHHQLRI